MKEPGREEGRNVRLLVVQVMSEVMTSEAVMSEVMSEVMIISSDDVRRGRCQHIMSEVLVKGAGRSGKEGWTANEGYEGRKEGRKKGRIHWERKEGRTRRNDSEGRKEGSKEGTYDCWGVVQVTMPEVMMSAVNDVRSDDVSSE